MTPSTTNQNAFHQQTNAYIIESQDVKDYLATFAETDCDELLKDLM